MTTTVTIAVVDDDDSVRRSPQQLLRAADFTLTYASAEEHLERREQVDCLMVDVNLAGMNGVELLQTLAAMAARHPPF